MNYSKKTPLYLGLLFLLALIPNIIANEMLQPIMDSPHFLQNLYLHKQSVIIANALNITCGIAMIFIPLVLLPSVIRSHQFLIIGYVVFRAIEGVLFFFIAIKTFHLTDIGEIATQAPEDIQYSLFLAELTKAEIQSTTLLYLLVYCCGATLFYLLMYKAQLVPKALSAWGLAGTAILAAGPVLYLSDSNIFDSSTLMEGMIYFAPVIALNEFVLSIWMILKGFNVSSNDRNIV